MRGQRDLDALRREADDDRGRAAAEHVPGEPDRLRAADDLERVVDAARHDRARPLVRRTARRRASPRGDARARASPGRGRPRRSARRPRAARRRSPAGRLRRSRSRTRSPPAAPARRCAPRRRRSRRRSRGAPPATAAARAGSAPRCRRDDRPLGEARRHQPVLERRPSGRLQPGGAVHQHPGHAVHARGLAEVVAAGEARGHSRQTGTKQKPTGSPGATCVTPSPTASTTPGALVAEHDRPAALAERALREVEVGVADARGGDAHEHLVRARRGRAATSSTRSGAFGSWRTAARILIRPASARARRGRA